MFSITEDRGNKDIPMGMDRHDAKKYYEELWGTFQSKVADPVVEPYGDKYILRADLAPGGLKAFGGEHVIAECKYDTLTYCAPRQGHAMDAISMLAAMYNKKVVFFCPSSKRVSDHQGALFSYPHVDMRFVRIAAMPVLNQYAKQWAKENMANKITKQLGKEPTQIWCAVSTGTMTRALQIGWPTAEAHGVAVARNIHKGEIGDAKVVSATIPFLKAANQKHAMPFPSTVAYDAKAWDAFVENAKPGSILINVGSDENITRNLSSVNIDNINSYREWHDMGDMKTNRAFKNSVHTV